MFSSKLIIFAYSWKAKNNSEFENSHESNIKNSLLKSIRAIYKKKAVFQHTPVKMNNVLLKFQISTVLIAVNLATW